MRYLSIILFLFLVLPSSVLISCKNDDNTVEDPIAMDDAIQDPDSDDVDDKTPDEEETLFELEATVEVFNPDLVYDGYILVNDAGNNRAYLIDKEATVLHEWPLNDQRLGNDALLLPNGQLLVILEADTPLIKFGGKGGKIQLIEKDGTVAWDFEYSTEDYITHHDVELLPNGNVIALVWERIPAEEAMLNGWELDGDIFTEAVIEIDPSTNQIVWEWHSWDHIIQDSDNSKENFGSVADNPQLIDVNYNSEQDDGDIMHANGITYDAGNDLIYISVNFYHEVWVIDHATTTQEAASQSGGTYNKGGDLVYRFGNPNTYDNVGERLFYNNHYPNLLTDTFTNAGNLLIFVNMMNGTEQSIVYELDLPDTFDLNPNTDNEPAIVWSFTDPELFAPKVSGAVVLPNGNRMITEADFGIWEITEAGEVVWQFNSSGFFWRAYHYDKDAPEILALGL